MLWCRNGWRAYSDLQRTRKSKDIYLMHTILLIPLFFILVLRHWRNRLGELE